MTTKVNIWYSSDHGFLTLGGYERPDRWGHAGIKFKNLRSPYTNAYFSLYPMDVRLGPLPNIGSVIRRNRHDDMDDESCGFPNYARPDRIYTLQNLNEEQEIRAYDMWLSWERNPPNYFALTFNCCTAVAESLGFHETSFLWTPSVLEERIVARHGVRDRF